MKKSIKNQNPTQRHEDAKNPEENHGGKTGFSWADLPSFVTSRLRVGFVFFSFLAVGLVWADSGKKELSVAEVSKNVEAAQAAIQKGSVSAEANRTA